MLRMSDLQRLDRASLAEIKLVVMEYEEVRAEVEKALQNFCSARGLSVMKAETYQQFVKDYVQYFIVPAKQGKYCAILEQIKAEYLNG